MNLSCHEYFQKGPRTDSCEQLVLLHALFRQCLDSYCAVYVQGSVCLLSARNPKTRRICELQLILQWGQKMRRMKCLLLIMSLWVTVNNISPAVCGAVETVGRVMDGGVRTMHSFAYLSSLGRLYGVAKMRISLGISSTLVPHVQVSMMIAFSCDLIHTTTLKHHACTMRTPCIRQESLQ